MESHGSVFEVIWHQLRDRIFHNACETATSYFLLLHCNVDFTCNVLMSTNREMVLEWICNPILPMKLFLVNLFLMQFALKAFSLRKKNARASKTVQVKLKILTLSNHNKYTCV